MKKLSALIALSITGFALVAAAELSGLWQGAGKISDSDGFELACETMNFNVTHNATTLDVVPQFVCGGDAFEAPVGAMEIRTDGDLYRKGQKVGRLTQDTIEAVISENGSTMTIHVGYTQTKLSFNAEIRQADDPNYVMTITGTAAR